MDLMDLALKSNDFEWCKKISNIENTPRINLIDEEVENEILPRIKEMNIFDLELSLPIMVYAINNKGKFSVGFLRNKIKEMSIRYHDLKNEK